MNKFEISPPQVLNQTIFAGTETELFVNLTVSFTNPSPVSILDMGILNMSILVCCLALCACLRTAPCVWRRVQSGSVYLGTAQSASPVSLSQSDATISNWVVRMVRDDANADYISGLLAAYASGVCLMARPLAFVVALAHRLSRMRACL